MKRIVAMLLLLSMVLSMAGCGSTNTISDEELMEKVNAITPYISQELMDSLPLTDKTVTYTVLADLWGNKVDPESVPLQKWLELNTNVDLDWTILKSTTQISPSMNIWM